MMRTSVSGIIKRLTCQDGFSLVELITAITLIAVLIVGIAPRVGSYFGDQRRSIAMLTTVITRTFDDSFVNKRNNFLALHLSYPEVDTDLDINRSILERTNGFTVISIDTDGVMSESERPGLKAATFPGSFTINSVILENGQRKRSGTVLIPFYPEGYSSDSIIHVTTAQGRQMSIIISKMKKEPYIREGHANFETMWEGDAF